VKENFEGKRAYM